MAVDDPITVFVRYAEVNGAKKDTEVMYVHRGKRTYQFLRDYAAGDRHLPADKLILQPKPGKTKSFRLEDFCKPGDFAVFMVDLTA